MAVTMPMILMMSVRTSCGNTQRYFPPDSSSSVPTSSSHLTFRHTHYCYRPMYGFLLISVRLSNVSLTLMCPITVHLTVCNGFSYRTGTTCSFKPTTQGGQQSTAVQSDGGAREAGLVLQLLTWNWRARLNALSPRASRHSLMGGHQRGDCAGCK